MKYSSRQGKKGSKSDSVIIRAASSVSKVRAFDWVSAGQMTPAQTLWAGCLHTVTIGHGYLHLHFKRWSHLELWACQQLEGSSKDNAQRICGGPGWAPGVDFSPGELQTPNFNPWELPHELHPSQPWVRTPSCVWKIRPSFHRSGGQIMELKKVILRP